MEINCEIMNQIKYSPQFKDRRLIFSYFEKPPFTWKDWVLVQADPQNYHVVQITKMWQAKWSGEWKVEVQASFGHWICSAGDIFAMALPHEIDGRKFPYLGDTSRLHKLTEPISKKQFVKDFKEYLTLSLTPEKSKLALDGLKMEYLSMSLEEQLETAHYWEKIKL